MSGELVILPKAQEDIFRCAMGYTEHHDPSGQLALAFLDAVEQTLERLQRSPLSYAIRHDDVRGIAVQRRAPAGQPRRFHHFVFYRVYPLEIVVVQVFAMQDNPIKLRH